MITVRPSRIARLLLLAMVGLAFYSLAVLISWQDEAADLWMALWLITLLGVFFLVSRILLGQVNGRLVIMGADELMYVSIDPQLKAEKAFRLAQIDHCVVWNSLVAFRAIDENDHVMQFLILFDSVSDDEFRRLKVFLRWQ